MKRKLSLFCAVTIAMQLMLGAIPTFSLVQAEDVLYEEPEAPTVTYNMNIGWKFKKANVLYPLEAASNSEKDANGKYFYEVDYDDSSWESVSVPHAVNAEDSFDDQIADAGEGGLFRGFMFYRKEFTVPQTDAGKKFFIEFEAIRQSAYVYLNGELVGYYEAGVTAFGFDLTDHINYSGKNILAVATDNCSYRGQAAKITDKWGVTKDLATYETKPGPDYTPGDTSGIGYQWNTKDFNEVQGGITGNVLLHAKSQVYQTLPLYSNLKTRGTYIYADKFDITYKKATINVNAEVRNETNIDKDITLEVNVVENVLKDENKPEEGSNPVLRYSCSNTTTVKKATDADSRFLTVVPMDAYDASPAPTNADTVDVSYINASFDAENVNFWSPETPYLYDVYTVLKQGDEILDVQKTTTGFRKVTYDKTNGLQINDKTTFLTGYAQRATNEWAAIGVANDWLSDYDMQLVRESNSNFIRWMHVAPKPNVVRSGDKYGVVSVVPAGDKEGDQSGRSWDMRVEVMRDAMIFFRNSPSVIFWEAGNASISAEHMQEITDLKQLLDPTGGRFAGCRTLSSTDQLKATEYVGTMLNRNASTAFGSMTALNKFVPIMETEYHREESPRRVWDDYSPPDYDYDNKWLGTSGAKTDGFDVHDLTSEDFVVNDASSFTEFYADRVGGSSGKNYYAAAAALIWADSNQHGRNSGSENARTSGRVDAIRLKKQSFYAYQVMQSQETAIHIVGHWNYPQVDNNVNYKYYKKTWNGTYWEKTKDFDYRDPTSKTVYVVGTTDIKKMELYVNDTLVGTSTSPTNTFIFAFPNVDVTQSGKVSAKAYNGRNEVIAEDEIVTAGEPATIRLTPSVGLQKDEATGKYVSTLSADGSDIAYFDVEVVDAAGNVCPLNYDKIDFELNGDAEFLGGYNSGKFGENSVIHKNYVYAECGINRVFVKAGTTPGDITLSASIAGKIPSVTRTISSTAVEMVSNTGLTLKPQSRLLFGAIIENVEQVTPVKPLAKSLSINSLNWNDTVRIVDDITEFKDYYNITLNGNNITFINQPYKPDATTGVFSPAVPVLEALKAAGADFTYTYNAELEKPTLTMQANGKTIIAQVGKTSLQVDSEVEGDLMNAEVALINGDMYIEISSLVKYISGVTQEIDTTNKVHKIVFTA